MKNVMRNEKRTRNTSLFVLATLAIVAVLAACSIALPGYALATEATPAKMAAVNAPDTIATQPAEAASSSTSDVTNAAKSNDSSGNKPADSSSTGLDGDSRADSAEPSGNGGASTESAIIDDAPSSSADEPSPSEDVADKSTNNIPATERGDATDDESLDVQRVITGYAVISGNTRVGSMLVAGVEGAPEGVMLQYQWYRGSTPISGATSNVYTTTNADAGFDITCRVTAQGYEGALISGAIKPTAPPDPQAFAVYSDADKSLDFYKRPYVPNVGDTFAGKVVTAVYTGIEAEDFVASWFDHQNAILSVRFVDEIKPLTTAYWFTFDLCTSMDLRNLNTSGVTTMEGMFFGASSITSLDVSMLDTSKVTSMSWMFSFCNNLTSLDLSSWDTSRVTDMSFMFAYSGLLSVIDASNLNTMNVLDMTAMFESCEALESIDMSRWNTSNVTSMWSMFCGCTSLKWVDASNFDTLKVQQMILMFSYCPELTTIYVSPNVDWSGVPESDLMFSDSIKIVGGLGTKYEAGNEDAVYAVVDGLGGKPGYFTPKITVAYFDSSTGSLSQPVLYVYGLRADQSSLANFLGWATTPNALTPTFLPGDVILYDPANIRNIVLYPVVGENPEASVVISGGTRVGDMLTAVVTGVPAGSVFSYQWYRDGVAIAGATSATYALVRTDAKHDISCRVSLQAEQQLLISNVIGPIIQMITVEYWSFTEDSLTDYVKVKEVTAEFDAYRFDGSAPNVLPGYVFGEYWTEAFSDLVQDGWTADQFVEVFEAEFNETWDGMRSFMVYTTWNAKMYKVNFVYGDGSSGSTSGNWQLVLDALPRPVPNGYEWIGWFTQKEGGEQVFDGVRYSDLVADDTVMSVSLYARVKLVESASSLVITGTPNVAQTLTASVSGALSTGSFTYQWYRDGVAIDGATARTYTITYEDIACSLSCVAVDSSYGGTLTSNVLGPVDQEVTVVYWSWTDASPNEQVVVHTETARLSDLFNYKFDPNADEDPSNDYVGYRVTGWWDEWFWQWFDITAPESEFTTTIGDIARLDEWDGVSAINMYSDAVMRTIEVTYFANGYELENGFTDVRTVAWVNSPYYSGLKWHAHKLVDQRDDKGHSIDSSMTCGYILTELLETPWVDKLNIHLYWEEIDYRIVFVNPSGPRTTTHLKWADVFAFPDPGTYPGREFVGWFTEQDGSGTQATDGMTYAQLAHYDIVEEVVLYSFFRQLDLTGVVHVAGGTHVGDTLVATVEGEPADAQLVYQWYRGGKAIAGATKPTYLLISVDVGNTIKCEVSDANYGGTLVSNVLGPISGIQIPAGVFAVYAHEDKSLTFYNRESRPSAGDVYEGKTVTAVYADFETDAYEGETIPWHGFSHLITSVLVADEGIRPVSTANWFSGLGACTSIDIRKLDTSLVTSMAYMFASCGSLVDLKLGDFDTSNVTNMKLMFGSCRALEQLDVSGFDTSKVTSMESMFNGCSSLTSLDVSSFDTSNVTNMARMFFNCKSLTSLELNSLDTSSAADMSYMFYGCEKLVSVSLPRVGAASSIDLGYMFSTCPALVSVDLSGIDFSKVARTYNMFFNCGALEVVDLGKFEVTSDTEITQMFYGCSSLSTIFVDAGFGQALSKKTVNLFKGCMSLVGGNGTVFDANRTNGTYACIDGYGGKPGYFTPKITVAYYDPSTGTVSTPVRFVYGLEARASELTDFTGWALSPDATKAVFLPGEIIAYDPANVRDIVLYPVVGTGSSDPADKVVTVEYWSLTDASPADFVIVHTITTKLSDLFDPTFDQNADTDRSNDTLEYVPIGWWDANYCYHCSNALSDDEPRITLEELATLVEWDGVGPIVLYADLDVRMITVYLDYGGYEEEFSADPIFVCGWGHVPFNSSVYWQAHRFKGVFDDKGNQLDDSMNCAYILTELLDDPWSNTLNIHYVWEKIEYQVHFVYPNGVTTSQDVEYVEQLALPSEGAGFDYPGYEFVGWFTAADGAGQQVKDGATYASIVRDDLIESLTLYAYFQPVAATTEVLAA